jgi:Tol biopolymer transport system component
MPATRSFVAVLVVGFALGFSGCKGDSPRLSGTIAFLNGTGGVAVVGADGGGTYTLARGDQAEAPMRWSPDGKRLVFSMSRGGTNRLYVAGVGGQARRITRSKYEIDIDPAWSPDGRSIVFDAEGDGWSDLRMVNSDGSGEHKLTTGSYVTGNPAVVAGGDAWSPDGRAIAYLDHRGRVWLMKPNGSDRRRLNAPAVSSGGLSWSGVSWSPNGRELLYDAGRRIVVVNADGTGVRSVLPRGRWPVWSPDGRQVVFVSYENVYVVNSDGSHPHKIGSHGGTPSWSPDGRWVIYARFEGQNGDIYLVHPDGSDERQLTDTPSREADPVWSPVDSSSDG